MQWPREDACAGQPGMPHMLLARQQSSRTSPRTSWVRPPMRSRPHVLPRRKERARAQGGSSAGGSATSSRRRFASSYSTTSGCGTTSAGRCSTAESARKPDALDRLARDVHAWVATADPTSGTPYLVPLSLLLVWRDGADRDAGVESDEPKSPGDWQSPAWARLAMSWSSKGPHRRWMRTTSRRTWAMPLPPRRASTRARQITRYLYLRIHPRRMLVWREIDELDSRELMRYSRWLEGRQHAHTNL